MVETIFQVADINRNGSLGEWVRVRIRIRVPWYDYRAEVRLRVLTLVSRVMG